MFVDAARLSVRAGRGGDGCVSFRREKFAPRGGPDGGDGGKGGDVLFLVDPGLRTLLHLRHQTLFEAGRGADGSGKECSGAGGGDCLVRVPPGTILRDAETGAWIADLVAGGDSIVVARGGRGGKGNVHFKSSTRRTPRIATPGEEGERHDVAVELKLLADVGLVGLPNVGKSTLLGTLSNAHPRVGDFPFTTLEPSLGIVAVGESFSFVMADIPGLIEGAHQGRGLGIAFLKHLERTRLLLFLLDSVAEDPEADLRTLRNELACHSASLSQRPALVAMSRADLRGPGWRPPPIGGVEPLAVSAHARWGLPALLTALREKLLETAEPAAAPEEKETPAAPPRSDLPFAMRLDRGEAMGPRPWPDRWFVGPAPDEPARAGHA